jgi:hypothetical protein
MNNQYSSTKNNYDFSNLKNETNYSCQNSCTCKFLGVRTEFDKKQFDIISKLNNTDYATNMFKSYKQTRFA